MVLGPDECAGSGSAGGKRVRFGGSANLVPLLAKYYSLGLRSDGAPQIISLSPAETAIVFWTSSSYGVVVVNTTDRAWISQSGK